VLPRVAFSGLISNGDKSTVMLATGVEPDSEFAVKGPFLNTVAGDVLAGGAQQMEVMLGEGLAKSLKAKPGSSLTLLASTTEGALNALDVTVQGVFSTGIPEIDKRLVYTDVATAQRLIVTPRVSSFGVFLRSMEATDPARARIAAALPQLAVQTWLDQAMFYRSVKELYNRIFGTLGLIIGVIVVFVVTNAMAMAIVERTREIGILRAIGASQAKVVQLVINESTLICLAGVVTGILFAFTGRWLLPHVFPTLTVQLTREWALIASALGLGGGLLGSFYPAIKAARMDPIQALNFE
jgi:putative ABC transport system permease protein